MSDASFPHCDSSVLHGPDMDCKYCNMYPDLQKHRVDNNINFTGEGNPNKAPCPAEASRSLDIINHWGGNTIHDSRQEALEVLGATQDLEKTSKDWWPDVVFKDPDG